MFQNNPFTEFARNFLVFTLVVILIIPGCGGGGGSGGGNLTTHEPLIVWDSGQDPLAPASAFLGEVKTGVSTLFSKSVNTGYTLSSKGAVIAITALGNVADFVIPVALASADQVPGKTSNATSSMPVAAPATATTCISQEVLQAGNCVTPTPLSPAPACVAPNVLLNGVCVTPSAVAALALSPTNPTVVKGATVQLTATATDSSGNTLSSPYLQWISSNPFSATVDSTGLVTAVAVGSSTITVTDLVSNVTSSTSITVPGIMLNITPTNPSAFPLGALVQLTASATDALLNPVSNPANLQWTSSNPAVATVDATGLLTTTALGSTVITVTDPVSLVTKSTNVSVTIQITPANPFVGVGQTIQLSMMTINPAPVFSWTSSDSTVATVDSTGLMTGMNLGTATISARDQNSSALASTTLTVSNSFVMLLSASCAPYGLLKGYYSSPIQSTTVIGNGIAAGPVGSVLTFLTKPDNGNFGPPITSPICDKWTALFTNGSYSACSRGANDPEATSFYGSILLKTTLANTLTSAWALIYDSTGQFLSDSGFNFLSYCQ